MRTILLAFGVVVAAAVATFVIVWASGRDAVPVDAASAPVIGSGGMPDPGAGQPDLVVTSIVSNQNLASPCQTPAGVRVTVRNQGTAAAPASFAGVSAASSAIVEVIDFPALAVSQEATVYAPVFGIPSGDDYTAYVDPLDHIDESNDANNILVVEDLIIGSLPTCTSTPTITATFTPTVTPTPTGFSGQDTDGDGILGSVDNCPFVFNPGQENTTDGNLIDHSPPYNPGVDDKTNPLSDNIGDVCDTDWDNDGLGNGDEFTVPCPTPTPGPGPTPGPCGPPPCTTGTTGTDSVKRDTDGDRALDGVECSLGTDPTSASSAPAAAQCGPLGDADGDGLSDRIEYCYYGTFTGAADSDNDANSDGGSDGCEARSFNGDRIVNVADMGMLAVGISGAVAYHPNVDVNKDGNLNPADQGMVAAFISPPGRCPNGMPDLRVLSMWIEMETGSSCAYTSTQLGLRVTVQNAGNYSAGAFLLRVDGIDQLLSMGLATGQTLSIWLGGAPYSNMGNHSAIADSGNTVFESNEANNSLSQFLPIPTVPPTCTPTPTASPTVTPTPT